jgi:cyclopropane-fatty-acyl-phospholipid synthase
LWNSQSACAFPYVDALLDQLFADWKGASFGVRVGEGRMWRSAGDEPRFVITFRDPRLIAQLATSDLDALGEAYMDGAIEVEGDLLSCFPLIDAVVPTIPARPATPALHTLERDREAVCFHYELPDAFFALFLDPLLVYSCAYYETADTTLETAQRTKLDYVCRKLQLQRDEELLDLGCGWGGLVVHAASTYGVRATGITLSQQQAEVARERIARAGLADRCRIEVRDYRELEGQGRFDKIASVGAVEHVGEAKLPAYYRRCFELLRPRGRMLNHGIDSRPTRPLGGGNTFQRKYIFPDHELVPVSTTLAAAEGAGFEVRDVESLREHYALTLSEWYRRYEQNIAAARTLVGQAKARAFRAYLAGTAHQFHIGDLDLHQSLLVKSDGGTSGLPLTRGAWYRW